MRQMIEQLERLGRLLEARGWSRLLIDIEPDSRFSKEAIVRLEQRLEPHTPLTLVSANPANLIDLSGFPLPTLPSTSDPVQVDPRSKSAIAFEDIARRVGLDFTYFVDKQRLLERVYTFDFAGGGIGVLDYDQDGWPDLYLTQSCHWPPTDQQQNYKNRLFRNHRGESFGDVTELAGVGDLGFGHGVAIGDLNSDGFPEIYVNNLGANCLFLNNGDGTFSDWTEQSGTAGDDYSLSAVIADLNRDGLPDLYVVNYLGGDALSRQCRLDGRLIQCSPKEFPGQQTDSNLLFKPV